jgi:toxin ParE1/3/4
MGKEAKAPAPFMRIVWTERAVANLREIETHIAQERPAAAQRVAVHLLGSIEHLAEFPLLGRPGPRSGMRSLIVPPYIISYRVRAKALQILSIWHGRRKPCETS